MFQAYQNSLFNAASMMTNDPQAHHDAQTLELFKNTTCSNDQAVPHKPDFSVNRADRNESTCPRNLELFEVEYKSVGQASKRKKTSIVVDYSGSMSGGKMRRAETGFQA